MTQNKYVAGLMSLVDSNDKSVEILTHVSNEDYDKLLSENVIYLDLVDASACNTVLECLVRSTPLVINRLPAVEEVLGVAYPGFYDSPFHAVQLLQDVTKIQEMHEYLLRQDKSQLSTDYFVEHFQQLVEAIALAGPVATAASA